MKYLYTLILLISLSTLAVIAQSIDFQDPSLQTIDDSFSKLQKSSNINYTVMKPYKGYEYVLGKDGLGKDIELTEKNVKIIETVSCADILQPCILEDEFQKILQTGDYVLISSGSYNCGREIYTNNTDLTDGVVNVILVFQTNCNTTDTMFRYVCNFKKNKIKPLPEPTSY